MRRKRLLQAELYLARAKRDGHLSPAAHRMLSYRYEASELMGDAKPERYRFAGVWRRCLGCLVALLRYSPRH